MGIGRVVESSLYEPLACGDRERVSRIIASAARFFRRLGLILAVYVGALCFVYPAAVRPTADTSYTVYLILILSISSFSEYFFSLTDTRLLNADQHMYVLYGVSIITKLSSLLVSIVLIRRDCPIHILKLTVAVLCLGKPVFLRIYVNRHYQLNRKIRVEGEPIRNKWYGLAQHIDFVVLKNTDNLVLTVFSTLQNVSVYAVYHMVLNGIGKLIQAVRGGFLSLMGELWAKRETEELEKTFSWFEWIIHTVTVFFYGCAGVLIVPFVQIYTKGVTDAEYIQPLFAVLLTAAFAFDCFRTPYHTLTLAAGHYKETQRCYFISAMLNLSISILTVRHIGLVGVAAGTLAALGYQMIWMARYCTKHLIRNTGAGKRILADLMMIVAGTGATYWLRMGEISYGSWIWLAVRVGLLWTAAVICVNVIVYPDKIKRAWKSTAGRILKRISSV